MNGYRTILRVIGLTAAFFLCNAAMAQTYSASGAQAVFNVTLTSSSGELAIGDFETFELALRDSSGAAVAGAVVAFSGGMPGHGHGFPTVPVVTEIGGGLYKLDGVKFSMGGAWEMTFDITADGKTDSVTLNLDL
jgi:hypothetical protein